MLTLYIVSKHTRMDIVMIGTLEDQGAAPLFIVYIWWVLFQFWISSTFSVLDYIPNSTCYLKRLWYYYEIDFLQQIIITTFLVCCQSPKRRLQTMVWGQGGLGVGGVMVSTNFTIVFQFLKRIVWLQSVFNLAWEALYIII